MKDWLQRIAGVLKHLWLTAGGLLCRQGPLSASRWRFGVWIGPPKVPLAPKPTSSVRINRTLGAPAGASIAFGKLDRESFTVRPIRPWKGGSAHGSTSPCAAAERGNAADAHGDTPARDVDLSDLLRRLIPAWFREALVGAVLPSSLLILPSQGE